MAGLYLTIDDSPSGIFPELCAYLKERNIPAVFFARGDLMSLYPERIVQAIKDGFVIANHSWSHQHARKLGADLAVREVIKTQKYIDDAYQAAGIKRPGPYMRWPHMDSGMGAWPLRPEAFSSEEQKAIKDDYYHFYFNKMTEPDESDIACHNAIEKQLQKAGYRQMAFENSTVPWYARYAASESVSTQGTFCHPDWIMAKRHAGKMPDEQRTIAALNTSFDRQLEKYPGSAQILVMHDHVELWPHFQKLIEHMLTNGHKFLPIPV